ncbi:MAG TPA: M56 family metallopeptidase [Longimicrobiales bacterium]|nr:M56 family metallopeptidase [Longimicrobiales bacterium]
MIAPLLAGVGLSVLQGAWMFALLLAGLTLAARLTNSPETRYVLGRAALLSGAASIPLAGTALWVTGRLDETAFAPARSGLAGVVAAEPVGEVVAQVLVGAGAIWLCGVVVLALRTLGDWRRVRRWLAALRTARPEWRREAGAAAADSAVAPPACYESDDLDSPMLVGLRKPVLVLPAAAFDAMTEGGRRALLLHEMAHLEAGHASRRGPELIAEHLLFFHPLLPLLKSFIDQERERTCDQRASQRCGSRSGYARALVGLELLRTRPMRLSLGAGGSSLVARIRWLVTAQASPSRSRRSPIAAATLALAGVVTLAAGLTTTPDALALTRAATPVGAHMYTINAVDPAGEFTLTMRQGRALHATIDGQPVPQGALIQKGRDIRVLAGTRPILAVRLNDRGGITWQPRPPAAAP